VSAIDAATGKALWKGYTVATERPVRRKAAGIELMGPSGAGIWSSPTVDPALHRFYVTTGDNDSDPPSTTSDASVAFDIATGKLAWSRQMTGGDTYNVGCEYPKHQLSRNNRTGL
jgi:polyvinyl alcohol dehydrogenase (cytochrome)